MVVCECADCIDSMPIPSNQAVEWTQRRRSCAPSRTLLGGGGKSARAGGKPTEYVAVMGGLSPVPLGQRQGPWRDRRRRTVRSARKKRENDFRIRSVLYLAEMEAACRDYKFWGP